MHENEATNTQNISTIQVQPEAHGCGETMTKNERKIFAISKKIYNEDMIVLGCVIHPVISSTVSIKLPGFVTGILEAINISPEIAKNPNLSKDIFNVGDTIPVKIIKKKRNGILFVSTKPSDINTKEYQKELSIGSLIWASITRISKNEYELDGGIDSNTKVILPFSKVENQTDYVIGKHLWCVVTFKNASKIIVSGLEEDLLDQMQPSKINLKHLLPGSLLQFNITNVSKWGLRGKFDSFECVVPQLYLNRTKEYKCNETVSGWVLFVDPKTNCIYITLRLVDKEKNKLEFESVFNAKVTSVLDDKLIIKMNDMPVHGFIMFGQLRKDLNVTKTEFQKIITDKYKINTEHSCEVLIYNYLEDIYLCEFIKNRRKESRPDIPFGQKVKCIIRAVKQDGILVKFGKHKGIIPNLHITNRMSDEFEKESYRRGQTVTAKIVSINDEFDEKIILTMKKDLIKSNTCLCDYNNMDMDKEYVGVVSKEDYPESEFETDFYRGQTVCMSSTKPILGLTTLNDDELLPTLIYDVKFQLKSQEVYRSDIQVGQVFNCTIEDTISHSAFLVYLEGTDFLAVMPELHLSSNVSHAISMIERCQIEDRFENVICVWNGNEIVVSRRETEHFIGKEIPDFHSLTEGQLLRCFYLNISDEEFIFNSVIKCYDYTILVPFTEITDKENNFNDIRFYSQQLVIVKIQSINEEHKQIIGTAKLSEVFDYDPLNAIGELESYFKCMDEALEDFRKWDDCLLVFKEGTKVKGEIKSIHHDSKSITVYLQKRESGTTLLMSHAPNAENLKIGDQVNCVILHIDYFYPTVYVSLYKNYAVKKSDRGKPPKCGQIVVGKVLLVTKDIVQCLVTNRKYKYMVYLPVKLHPNDFLPERKIFEDKIHKSIKIQIIKLVGNRIFGLSLSTINALYANAEKQIENKWKFEESKSELLKKHNCYVDDNDEDSNARRIFNRIYGSDDDLLDDDQGNSENLNGENSESHQNDSIVESEDERMSSSTEEEEEDNIEENRSEFKFEESKIEQNVSIVEPKDEIMSNLTEEEDNVDENGIRVEQSKSFKNKKRPLSDELFVDTNPSEFIKTEEMILTPKEENDYPLKVSEQHSSSNSSIDGKLKKRRKCKRKSSEKEVSINNQSEDIIDESFLKLSGSTVKESKAKHCLEVALDKKHEGMRNEIVDNPSAEEFEKLLVDDPKNWELWLKYVTFLYKINEYEKAKEVTERALANLNFDKHDEIWQISLKETIFDDVFDKIFDSAVTKFKYNLEIYVIIIRTLGNSGEFSKMDKIIKKCCNAFRQNPDMWIKVSQLLYESQRLEEARKFGSNALVALENKSTHLQVLLNNAIMEFDFGDKTRGEDLFEKILLNYPSNWNVWQNYAEQFIKNNDIDAARNVYNRAFELKLSTNKIKQIYKHFVHFEEAHGSEADLERLKGLFKSRMKQPKIKNLLL